jgi:hypothetical protein
LLPHAAGDGLTGAAHVRDVGTGQSRCRRVDHLDRVLSGEAQPLVYPVGGGRIAIAVAAGSQLDGLELMTRGPIRRLDWDPAVGAVVEVESAGLGNALSIVVEAEHVTEVFTGSGAPSMSAVSPGEEGSWRIARGCVAVLRPWGQHP